MADQTVFRCYVCRAPLPSQHLIFARRVEQLVPTVQDGKPGNILNILQDDGLLLYCRHHCWKRHEGEVATLLRLQSTYPQSGMIVPCSRCGVPVHRTVPHVSYAITEMIVDYSEDSPVAEPIDDTEFAVLCTDCERPDAPAEEAAFARPEIERAGV